MKTTVLMGLIVAAIGTAMVASSLIPAATATTVDRNLFGQESKKLAQSGQGQEGGMGQHASQQDEPRVGIGNVGEKILGQGKLHPSEVAACLADGDTDCPDFD